MTKKERKEIIKLLVMQIDSFTDGRPKSTELILAIVELKYSIRNITENYMYLTTKL